MSEENLIAAKILGTVPSGLFIVTAAHDGKRAAYLASFVQQASFQPLIFSVACHPERYPYELITASKRFAINVVPEGDKILLKTFAKGHGPDADPFVALACETLDGIPVLKDAIGAASFKLVGEAKPGDHALLFGEVLSGIEFDHSRKPWVHLRKSALNY